MEILHGIDGLQQLPHGSAMSIGNFDGIHRGHSHILNFARELRSRDASAMTVVTFEPHPLTVLRPALAPPRLTSPVVKRQLLTDQSVDFLLVLPPEPSVLNLSAEDFWHRVRDQAKPRYLIEGPDFTFGKARSGNVDKLRQWTTDGNVNLQIVHPIEAVLLNLTVVPISSTVVRWLVGFGRMRDAAICLGRPYALEGPVIEGYRRGRQLGVPTANLRCDDQLVPLDGVYAGRCEVDGTTYPVALSIGTLPTFGEYNRQIEAHLIGFDGDLYHRVIRVDVLDWIRDQEKFPNLDALKARMRIDMIEVQRRQNLSLPAWSMPTQSPTP